MTHLLDLFGLRRLQGGERVLLGALAAILVSLLGLAAVGATAAVRKLDAGDPSPATGHAQIVAHGVAALPPGPIAWRVVTDTAELPADAPVEVRALGFALADQDALLINDATFGTQARLAAGEAVFVPSGVEQQRVALGDASTTYHCIALIPAADADDAQGDELLYAGEAFASPGENRDLDLLRDVLEPDEAAEFGLGGESPALLFVTAGGIDVLPAADDTATPTALGAGEADTVRGDVVIRATGTAGATFVVAIVGPEVPAPPAAGPSPSAAPAAVSVEAFGCPVGYVGNDEPNDCDDPLDDVTFGLTRNGSSFAAEERTAANGVVRFDGLVAGTYVLTGGVPTKLATQTVLCRDGEGLIPFDPPQGGAAGAVFDVAAGDQITCGWYVTPMISRAAAARSPSPWSSARRRRRRSMAATPGTFPAPSP